MKHYYYVLDLGRYHANTEEEAYRGMLEWVYQCLPDALASAEHLEMIQLRTSGPCGSSCSEREEFEV